MNMEGLLSLKNRNLTCHICGAEVFLGEDICKNCLSTLPYNDKTFCLVCGRATADEGVCMECKATRPKVERARSRFVYEDDVRKLILSYKSGARYLSDYFSRELAPLLKEYFPDAELITFVPMYKGDENARGFNQSEELALRVGQRTGVEVKELAVKKKRTARQKRLSLKERRQNLIDCFKIVDRSFKGKTVVIVDDVLTTGATVDALATLFNERGAKKVYALTIASVRYEGSPVDK